MTNLKSLFGFGLFIHKDDFGQPCCIGDQVEVIRPAMKIPSEEILDGFVEIPEATFTGTLVLLKSKGVMLRLTEGIPYILGRQYIKPPITNHSRNIWKWRKL